MSGSAAKMAGAPLSKRRLRLWLRMLRTTRQTEAALRDFLRETYDTTLPRFDVMAALERAQDGLKMSELSRQLLVSNGNVTGIIERLVRAGMVERVPIRDDRRVMRVRLTAAGAEKFSAMARDHEALIDKRFAGLADDDLDHLAEQFAKLKSARQKGRH